MINSSMKLYEFVDHHIITHILALCKHELELKTLPPINFVDTPAVGNETSFGKFTSNGITVATLNRHPIDICRTLVHELVHWKQYNENMDMDGSDGSDAENQANAIAGIVMRRFAEQYPEYFVNSIPRH